MPRHLLIDGDVLAFMSAAACQHSVIGDDGFAAPFAILQEGEATLDNMVFGLTDGLGAESREIILSDPESNWRRSIYPEYKTHRTGDRPILLEPLKAYLRDKYGAVHLESLEADDTISIKATDPEERREVVVVGRDKDFNNIPGLHHAIKKDVSSSGRLLVREVSPWEATRHHLIQTLSGDRVDGFPGCPGIGKTRAERIIDNPVRLVPQEGVKTRGVNKGDAVTRWMAEPTKDLWACIVSHYRKGGQGEKEALLTARLANLLQHDQYASGSITLWTPDRIGRWEKPPG